LRFGNPTLKKAVTKAARVSLTTPTPPVVVAVVAEVVAVPPMPTLSSLCFEKYAVNVCSCRSSKDPSALGAASKEGIPDGPIKEKQEGGRSSKPIQRDHAAGFEVISTEDSSKDTSMSGKIL
jgi:hypothetical protein